MSGSLLLTAGLSVLFVVVLLTWRVWPVALGRVKPGDDRNRRLFKWNRYLLRLMRGTLKGQIGVAQAGFFKDPQGGEHTIATWAMVPTLIPDVEFIALAHPGEDGTRVEAVAEAAALRALLGTGVRDQGMWGHEAWLYTWPEDADLDAVVKRLIPVAAFRERFGLPAEPPPAPAA
ncbi:MAG: hypothetical protein R3F60_24340 [bacterium]